MRRAGEWWWEATAAAVVVVIVWRPGGGYSLTSPLSDQFGFDSTKVSSPWLVVVLQGVHQEG